MVMSLLICTGLASGWGPSNAQTSLTPGVVLMVVQLGLWAIFLGMYFYLIRAGIIRQVRSDQGQCLGCGHQLIAENSRCPECGAAKAQ